MDQELDSNEYEIIVVDDASTEETAVLKDYVSRVPNILYFNHGKLGMSGARNFGISVARGDWLYFCDSDDFLQPRVLRGIIDAAEKNELEVIFANFKKVAPDQVPVNPRRYFSSVSPVRSGLDYFCKPHRGFTSGAWSYLVRRSVVTANNLRFKDILFVEDKWFMLDLMPCVSRAAHIDVDLYYYVRHDSSVIHEKKRTNGSAYMADFFKYIIRLHEESRSGRYGLNFARVMNYMSRINSYFLLLNVFRYCPVSETVSYLSRLEDIEIYPIRLKGRDKRQRLLLRWMNTRWLWLLGCRLYHILPGRVRGRI